MIDRSDLDVTDDVLAAMGHGELVALLNRLYSAAGERAITASKARASSDDELRERIRGVRRRLLAKTRGRSPAEPRDRMASVAEKTSRTPVADSGPPTRRAFVALISDDQALARRARASCTARGIVLVWIASPATLAKLVTSVTPTHLVIEGAADRIDETIVRDLAARGARIRWCRGPREALDAVLEIL